MVNKIFIVGRLARDPEIRYTQNGSAIANMTVATDESFTGSDGNKVERTEWHRVTVFGKMAENCGNYLGKGSLVHVEGSLATRKWQDQNGQDRYTTEIKAKLVQFLDRRNDDQRGGDARQSRQGRQDRNNMTQPRGGSEQGDYSDDVPF